MISLSEWSANDWKKRLCSMTSTPMNYNLNHDLHQPICFDLDNIILIIRRLPSSGLSSKKEYLIMDYRGYLRGTWQGLRPGLARRNWKWSHLVWGSLFIWSFNNRLAIHIRFPYTEASRGGSCARRVTLSSWEINNSFHSTYRVHRSNPSFYNLSHTRRKAGGDFVRV